jgi:hypothetical protein
MAIANENAMRTITLPLRALGFIVATRAALAAGLGLLFANRLSPEQRRAAGLTLVGVGAITTFPAAKWVSRGLRRSDDRTSIGSDRRLIGATRFARKGDEPL